MISFREIVATTGQIILVDSADYERLAVYRWYIQRDKKSQCEYAVRNEKCADGKTRTAAMAREILGLKRGDPRRAEHREPSQTLDNRRSNLRIATQQQNCFNRRRRTDNTSGYKGVSYHKGHRKYRAYIAVSGKTKSLGERDTAEAAYRELYVPAALELHGEFARLA